MTRALWAAVSSLAASAFVLVALALVPILLGALWVHAGNGWVFTAMGGGWEYPLFLAAASGAQALLGDGAWAISGRGRAAPGLARRYA